MTTADLDQHAIAIREHEDAVRRLGFNARCAPGCPHETAPSVPEVRAALGEATAFDWSLFLAGEGEW